MSRILHIPTRPLWQRPAVAAAAVAALAALVGLLSRGGSEPEAGPAAVSSQAGAQSPALAGAGSAAMGSDAFPAVRLTLVEVALQTVPPSAVLEVETRRATVGMGQEVFPGIRLDRVFSDRVVLVHGQATRTLRLAPPAAAVVPVAAVGADGEDPNEIRVRNKGIDTKQLTTHRPMAADAFLRGVLVAPNPRGGFVVEEVMRDSVYEKLGLRRGDVIYSLDVPGAKPVDEGSMISLMQQTTLEMEVYRQGAALRLKHDLTADTEAAPAAR